MTSLTIPPPADLDEPPPTDPAPPALQAPRVPSLPDWPSEAVTAVECPHPHSHQSETSS